MADLESLDEQFDGMELTVNQGTDVSDKARKALEAKREAERMLRECKEEALRDKKAMKEARKQAEREAKQQAKREAHNAKRAAAEERKRAEAAKKAEKEARKQAQQEAKKRAEREADEATRAAAEGKKQVEAAKKAEKEARKQAQREAKERAKREADEAKRAAAEEKKQAEAAKKADKEARKRAEREAEEAAKRESKDEKKAQKAQLEAGVQDVQSDETSDPDRSQTELLSDELGDAAIENTKPTNPTNRPIPKHDVFEGRVQVLIPERTESTFVKQLETLLMEMDDSRIVCSCGSAEGGKTIIFYADKPMPLIQTLSEYPIVETVTRKGKNIQVTLGSNQESMAPVADT